MIDDADELIERSKEIIAADDARVKQAIELALREKMLELADFEEDDFEARERWAEEVNKLAFEIFSRLI